MLLSRLRLQRHAQKLAFDKVRLNKYAQKSQICLTVTVLLNYIVKTNGVVSSVANKHKHSRIHGIENCRQRPTGFRDNKHRKGNGLSNKCDYRKLQCTAKV